MTKQQNKRDIQTIRMLHTNIVTIGNSEELRFVLLQIL
jgi:hypothetical protein